MDFKVKHVTGYGSARELDLGLERGEADCRAASDNTCDHPADLGHKQAMSHSWYSRGPVKSRLLPKLFPLFMT
ncbi:MAG TPA: hypothetical protein VF452_14765 [Candidatus Binatia bacterium]